MPDRPRGLIDTGAILDLLKSGGAVPRRAVSPGVIRLVADADARHQLTQRERIVLGLLAQTEGLTAIDLIARLELDDPAKLRTWMAAYSISALSSRPAAPRPPAISCHPACCALPASTGVPPSRVWNRIGCAPSSSKT